MLKKQDIRVLGHQGTWCSIESKIINGTKYYLMEHEQYGDMAKNIIIDEENRVVLTDVCNGFNDLEEALATLNERSDSL
ncbi:hypothetical protein LGL55_06010 [Clostridium tagluense]|uniref:hypothetical protein n=1 Tax=Clostridium tagluense TaxID=360422 RepID=UPI001CF24D82|nr:hypothetical protein [Clostridium tagluense]MCB2310677.1 hypothetical protein [Clostridium tagluense]MCB2315593.1 hypothetical protein [Clostridium tagluense]MCB2320447.1 hypothetical protein [Clostridium tagluense]MCB2325270.1 hypothetical protein [Clostridium tagluense]MCB2330122.1 hypothetical protein [Clostridium tagluense]